MRSFFAALVMCLLAAGVSAQDSTLQQYQRGARIVPCLSFNHIFVGDYLMGFGGGIYERTHNWSSRLQFDFRPYFKTVTYSENDTLRHQYKEKDFFLNLALEKEFRLKSRYPMLLPYVQVNFGLLWGNFKAFDKAPESKWVLSPGAGLNLAINPVFNFKLGYQYLKPLVMDTPPHRLVFQILFTIDEL